MNKRILFLLLFLVMLSACSKKDNNDKKNNMKISGSKCEILERKEGKLPTILLYNKDGVKLTLSEPDLELMEGKVNKAGNKFERAGMLTLENNKDINVNIDYNYLYINGFPNGTNLLGMLTEPGKTSKKVIDLTPYKYDYQSLLENSKIYSIGFETSIVDGVSTPFDNTACYISLEDKKDEQTYLEKIAKKENKIFENEFFEIYYLSRHIDKSKITDPYYDSGKFYEFIFHNKSNKHLVIDHDYNKGVNFNGKDLDVGILLHIDTFMAPGYYGIGEFSLPKVDVNKNPILNYDEIKFYGKYYFLDNFYDKIDKNDKGSSFEYVFKPGKFGLETKATLEETKYEKRTKK